MKFRYIICSVFFCYSLYIISTYSSLSNAETGEELINRKVLRLTLEEGKIMVLQKNLDIAIERIAPDLEEVRTDKERVAFDPAVTASVKREDSKTPLSSRSAAAAGGRTSTESETYTLSTDISGKIPLGTEYSLGFDDTRSKNTFNRFDPEYDSFAGIKITQPLLKGFGNDVNRFNIHISQKNRDISVSELRQRVIDTVSEFKKAYWDMVLAIEDLKVKNESLRLAESLLDLNRKKLKAEVVSPLEVTQAEAGVAARREDVIIVQKTVREKETALKRFISDDIYAMRDVEIIPADVPSDVPVNTDLEAGCREGLQNRPDYLKARIEIEKKELTIQYADNQKFPDIDLEASYGYNGLGSSFGSSLSGMENNPEWTLGVMIKFPLWNRSAKGDLRIARLEARQALLNLKKLEQEILAEISNAVQSVEADRKRMEAARISKQLAEESLRAEELKLEQGLSTSHNVLDFQEDLSEARSREISALIDYNKSLIEFSRVKGTILEEEGISLDAK